MTQTSNSVLPELLVGIKTYWDLAESFDRRKIHTGLEEMDMPSSIAVPSDKRTFKKAIQDVFPHPDIIRSLPNGYRVLRDGQTLPVFEAVLKGDGTLLVKHDHEGQKEEVQGAWTATLKMLDPTVLARNLQNIIRKLDGLPLRSFGTVYWLPPWSVKKWDKVVKLVQEASPSGSPEQISTWSAYFDRRGQRSFASSMLLVVTERSGNLLRKALGQERGFKYVQSRLEEIRQLRVWVQQIQTAVPRQCSLANSLAEIERVEQFITASAYQRWPQLARTIHAHVG